MSSSKVYGFSGSYDAIKFQMVKPSFAMVIVNMMKDEEVILKSGKAWQAGDSFG